MRRRYTASVGATFAATFFVAASLLGIAPARATAQTDQAAKIFAQTLVERAQAAHPEADEIGILATTQEGCRGIASTDKSDVGEACEAEDIQPMKTGKTSVEKEGSGFDVSVLLHDATGKTIGVLAIGFKGAPGRTEATVTETAKKMEAEMAAQITSKAKLFEPSK
jgi:hypothetical protein